MTMHTLLLDTVEYPYAETLPEMLAENFWRVIQYLEKGDLRMGFDMSTYIRVHTACESVGCVLGHAAIVLGSPATVDYGRFAKEAFGVSCVQDVRWDWCFSPCWQHWEPSPIEAAARLRYYVTHHDCPASFRQLWQCGDDQACYAAYKEWCVD